MSEVLSLSLDTFDDLLDWNKLQPWIEAQTELPGSGPVVAVEKLTGGSQNNLFLMSRKGGRFVLRRPPKHLRTNSNKTMLREAQVLKALHGSDVPHPTFFAVCEDLEVIGAAFYTMAPLEGFSPLGEMPGDYATDRNWRHAMGEEFMKAAAALGAVDYEAAGLADFGKPDDWHTRQVGRWRSQLEGYAELPGYGGPSLAYVDEAGSWLSDNVPSDGRLGIIHGDFQFPNVMFSLERPQISGVIDWELSTIGDPMLDLGWVLTSWWEEGDPQVGGRESMVKPWDGFMTRADLVKLYGELSGRDMASIPWFYVLACYKLGCILEGTYARAKAGQASMDMGERLHNVAVYLFAKARQIIEIGRI